jgi:hypothetical protein
MLAPRRFLRRSLCVCLTDWLYTGAGYMLKHFPQILFVKIYLHITPLCVIFTTRNVGILGPCVKILPYVWCIYRRTEFVRMFWRKLIRTSVCGFPYFVQVIFMTRIFSDSFLRSRACIEFAVVIDYRISLPYTCNIDTSDSYFYDCVLSILCKINYQIIKFPFVTVVLMFI